MWKDHIYIFYMVFPPFLLNLACWWLPLLFFSPETQLGAWGRCGHESANLSAVPDFSSSPPDQFLCLTSHWWLAGVPLVSHTGGWDSCVCPLWLWVKPHRIISSWLEAPLVCSWVDGLTWRCGWQCQAGGWLSVIPHRFIFFSFAV